MTAIEQVVTAEFLLRLVAGMVVNFKIAGIAMVVGLVFGLFLAVARLGPAFVRSATIPVLGLMRAAPTFVVMFFLLNAVPPGATMFGISVTLSGVMIRQWRDDSPLGALQFLPNVTRVFFVLVMASGTGAAIGVSEGIAVILHEAERMSSLGEKLVLFAIGVLCFGAVLQGGFALINLLHRRISRRFTIAS